MAYAEHRDRYLEQLLQRAATALAKHGFACTVVRGVDEARAAVLERVPAGAVVGVGGSVTIRELGLVEELRAAGHVVLDHWSRDLPREDIPVVRRGQLTCDVFLTSVNAVTLDGKLVSMDATGQRVAATIYGPGRVVVVAGVNKIVRDVEEGIRRTRDVAAPMNARRLGLPAPCVRLGYCADCDSSARICRVLVVLERCPSSSKIEVVLVARPLGY